jgi:hypothetical protein
MPQSRCVRSLAGLHTTAVTVTVRVRRSRAAWAATNMNPGNPGRGNFGIREFTALGTTAQRRLRRERLRRVSVSRPGRFQVSESGSSQLSQCRAECAFPLHLPDSARCGFSALPACLPAGSSILLRRSESQCPY